MTEEVIPAESSQLPPYQRICPSLAEHTVQRKGISKILFLFCWNIHLAWINREITDFFTNESRKENPRVSGEYFSREVQRFYVISMLSATCFVARDLNQHEKCFVRYFRRIPNEKWTNLSSTIMLFRKGAVRVSSYWEPFYRITCLRGKLVRTLLKLNQIKSNVMKSVHYVCYKC